MKTYILKGVDALKEDLRRKYIALMTIFFFLKERAKINYLKKL